MHIYDYNCKRTESIDLRKDIVNNKGINLEISWYVTISALHKWNSTRLIENQKELKNAFASDQKVKKRIHELLDVLKKFIKTYKGYPSSKIKTTKAYCIFCYSDGAIEQSIRLGDDLSYFYLYIDIWGIKGTIFSLKYILKHELYHGIARAKENEKKLIEVMEKYSDKEEHIIRRHFNTITKGIDELEKYVQQGGKTWNDIKESIKVLRTEECRLDYLYKNEFGNTKLLLNMLADSILTILAMEVEDTEYIEEAVDADKDTLKRLENQTKHLKTARKIIENELPKRSGKIKLILETHKSTIGLIELILSFISLPIKGSALLMINNKFRDGTHNKYYQGSIHARAKRNKEKYLELAKSCLESDFIDWMLNSYILCMKNKQPSVDHPLKELHQNFSKYEQLGNAIKQRFLTHLEQISKNLVEIKRA